MVKTWQESTVVYGTEDLLTSLCNSVTRVLSVATQLFTTLSTCLRL